MNIKINGKDYLFKFKLSAALIYCKMRKIELWQMSKDMDKLNSGKATIEQIEIMRDFIYAGIKSCDENTKVKVNDITDELSDADFINGISKEMQGSFPEVDEKKK